MILNSLGTAMKNLPETIVNINSKDDSHDSRRVKSDLIEYAIETLLQEYMKTLKDTDDGREALKAKLLLHKLSKDL
jgi:ABC-type Fe2+-enterobactin transport system substrate-binding protein